MFFQIITMGILCVSGWSLLKMVSENKTHFFLSSIQLFCEIKYYYDKLFPKNKNKKLIANKVFITGQFINFQKKITNKTIYNELNKINYMEPVTMIIQYNYNDNNYYFITKKTISLAIQQYKEFSKQLNNNTNVITSPILNGSLFYTIQNENKETDITDLLHAIQGPLLNYNCIENDILYQLFKNEFNITISNSNLPKITLINNMAEEQEYNCKDNINLKF